MLWCVVVWCGVLWCTVSKSMSTCTPRGRRDTDLYVVLYWAGLLLFCIMLQCVVLCGSVLYCVVVCYVAVCCLLFGSVLCYVAVL